MLKNTKQLLNVKVFFVTLGSHWVKDYHEGVSKRHRAM